MWKNKEFLLERQKSILQKQKSKIDLTESEKRDLEIISAKLNGEQLKTVEQIKRRNRWMISILDEILSDVKI